jgi:uncharacterized protein
LSIFLQFRPALRAASVTQVSAAFLAARGLRALILDLDNTLVPWHGREVKPEVEAWLKTLHAAGVQLCIVSNTHRPHRLKELAAVLGVQYVPSGGKPRRRGFLRAIQAMGVTADETAVVGDQVMTDIWGGNRCGLLTILVEPLSPVEFIGTRLVSRNVERLLLRYLEKQGHQSDPVCEPTDLE